MPTTMKNPKVQPRKKGKQVQRVNAARPVLTPEDVKASARAYADRVHRSAPKKGLTPRPWIVLYIERWRHLSGLKRNVPGPVGEYRHAGPVA